MFKKYKQHKELIHNFLWRSLQIFGKQGVTFLIFILCAKLLVPYDFGIYNYILAVVFFLIMFGDFGVSSAVSKFTAEYNETNKLKLEKILFNSFLLIFGVSFFIILLIFLIGDYFLKENYKYIFYAVPMVFLAPISSLYDGIFRGLKRFKELALISLFTGGISIGFVYFFVVNYGIIGALLSQSLFYFTLVLFLSLFYRNLKFGLDTKIIKEITSYSLILGISSFGYYLYNGIDALVLGYFGYIEEINPFRIYVKITSIFVVFFSIFGQIIAPNITVLKARKEYDKIIKKFFKYGLFSLLISLISLSVLFFTIPVLINFYLPHLASAMFFDILNLLIWTTPLVLVSAVTSHFIVSTGHPKIGLITIPFGFLNVILNIILIKKIGPIGVAYSTLVVLILSKISTWILIYRALIRDKKLNK